MRVYTSPMTFLIPENGWLSGNSCSASFVILALLYWEKIWSIERISYTVFLFFPLCCFPKWSHPLHYSGISYLPNDQPVGGRETNSQKSFKKITQKLSCLISLNKSNINDFYFKTGQLTSGKSYFVCVQYIVWHLCDVFLITITFNSVKHWKNSWLMCLKSHSI